MVYSQTLQNVVTAAINAAVPNMSNVIFAAPKQQHGQGRYNAIEIRVTTVLNVQPVIH